MLFSKFVFSVIFLAVALFTPVLDAAVLDAAVLDAAVLDAAVLPAVLGAVPAILGAIPTVLTASVSVVVRKPNSTATTYLIKKNVTEITNKNVKNSLPNFDACFVEMGENSPSPKDPLYPNIVYINGKIISLTNDLIILPVAKAAPVPAIVPSTLFSEINTFN